MGRFLFGGARGTLGRISSSKVRARLGRRPLQMQRPHRLGPTAASRMVQVEKGSARVGRRRIAGFRGAAARLLSFFVARSDRRAPFPGGLSRFPRIGGRVAPSGSALRRAAAKVQWLFGRHGWPRVHPFLRHTESPTGVSVAKLRIEFNGPLQLQTQPTQSLPAQGFACLAPRRSNNAP